MYFGALKNNILTVIQLSINDDRNREKSCVGILNEKTQITIYLLIRESIIGINTNEDLQQVVNTNQPKGFCHKYCRFN